MRLGRRRSHSGDRGLRTARLADEGWVLPWGLGRQGDHATPAFVARLAGEGLHNRTGRRWTPVGPVGGPAAGIDPAGLLTPRFGGWSLDWWVGADDRWRLPSREASVRQALVGAAPVVETVMRVPGGDAVHRCFAVPGALVVEVENRSPAPFAVAFAIRPLDPLGATAVAQVAVEGERVVVDGCTALVLPGPPGRVAASTGAAGDVADTVVQGRAGTSAAPVTCPEGLASVAVVLPVAHRTTVRAVVPLDGGEGRVPSLPTVDAVVRGWQAQGEAGLRAHVEPGLQGAFDAARLHLLAGCEDDAAPAEEVAVLVAALSRLGRHAEGGDLVRMLWSRQRTDGSFDEPGGRGAAGGPHLWALGEHLRRSRNGELAASLDAGIVAAEGWLRELDAMGRLDPPARRWAVDGRLGAARAVEEAGSGATAEILRAGASAGLGGDVERMTPAPTAAAVLRLCFEEPGGSGRPAVATPAGFDVGATLAAAAAEVADRQATAMERLAWLLQAGGPTWSWPDHVHPRTGAGSGGSGASRVALAGFLLLVRDVLVTEPSPGRADIVPLLPAPWRGQPLEVNDAVLADGTLLSFAIRWHGLRPALLWAASGPQRLAASGLDPSFTTEERRGEALLAESPSTTASGDGTVEVS